MAVLEGGTHVEQFATYLPNINTILLIIIPLAIGTVFAFQ